MALHGKKYSGDLYGRKYGTNEPFQKLGNVTELKTSSKVKTDTLTSTGKYDYGQTLETENTPEPTELSLKFNTFDKDGLARALMGEAYDINAKAVTFSDEPITVGLGWIKLANKDIDPASVVMTDDQGQPVDPTSYEVNAPLGMVRFNQNSTLLAGATVTLSGKTKGSAGYQIHANTLQNLPLELYLDGKDRITGKNGVLEMPHAVLSSEGDLDWFGDKWMEYGLKGTLVKDDGKESMTFTEYA